MTTAGQPVDVALFFDVEDIFNPPEMGSDESIMELADILNQEGLRGNFLFIGDRALQVRARGRKDVIDSLNPHDVGLHTRSARHPTNPEYVAGKSWDDAVALSLKYESEGVEILQDVFGKPCAALSSHNVYDSPHMYGVAGVLEVPYVYGLPAAPPQYGLSWYAGALSLPFEMSTPTGEKNLSYFAFEDYDYHADMTFQPDPPGPTFQWRLQQLDERLDRCIDEEQPFMTLFLFHPQRLRLTDFADPYWCPNGVNYPEDLWGTFGVPRQRAPEEVQVAVRNFRRLAQWLRRDPRVNVITVTEVAKKYGHQPATISRDELLDAATVISTESEIPLHSQFSPAEVVVGLARAVLEAAESGSLPSDTPRDDVLGPLRSPIWIPELQVCDPERLTALARQLVECVEGTGHLPATLGAPLERVGVNHLYRAFAEYVRAIDVGPPPSEVRFTRTMPCPAVASSIGIGFLKMVEGELIDPDTDVNTLYRDGKLQTWTLKPANTMT